MMSRRTDSASPHCTERRIPHVLGRVLRLSETVNTRSTYVFLLTFVLLAVGIVTASYLYLRNYERHYRDGVERQMAAIVDLKADELAGWREDYRRDAAVLFKNISFRALVRRFFEEPEDADTQRQLRMWLGLYPDQYHFDQVRLADAEGVTRMSIPAGRPPASQAVRERIPEVLRSRQVTLTDFYRCDNCEKIHLAVLVPILNDTDGQPPLGVVALRIDPSTRLYPGLSQWPTPSPTAETLLVRRDGNDVLFLNELRFRKNTALKMRVSLDEKSELPAVKAVLGRDGIVEGVDYRGEPVIAAVRAVAGSPWFLVAQVDTSEVYGPMRERLRAMLVLVCVLLLGAGAGLGLLWRQRSLRFHQERAADAARMQAITNSAQDAILMMDPQGKISYWNPAAEHIFGYTSVEAIGQSLHEVIVPQRYQAAHRAALPEFLRDGRGAAIGKTLEWHACRKDGREIAVSLSLSSVLLEGGWHGVGILRDITENKRAKEELAAAHKSLSDVLDAAVHTSIIATDPQGVITLFGKGAENMLGYAAEEMAGRQTVAVIHLAGEMADRARELSEKLGRPVEGIEVLWTKAHAGCDEERTWTYVRKDGSHLQVNLVVTAIRNDKGEVTGYLGVATDITRRMQMERQLQEANRDLAQLNRELEAVAAEVKDLMVKVVSKNDFTGRFTNPYLARCWETKKCDVAACPSYRNHKNLRCWEIAGTYCGGTVRGRFAQKLGDCTRCEVYQSVRTNPVTNLGETFNTMIAILKERQEELWDRTEELQAINAELDGQRIMMLAHTREMRALLDGMPGYCFLKDRNGEYIAANQMLCQALGKTEDDIVGASDLDLFPPGLARQHLLNDQRILSGEMPSLEVEEEIVSGQKRVCMLTRIIPVRAADGTVERLIGVSVDITARKAMEEELRTAARTDRLTGLPNRALFADRLQQAVLRSKRLKDYHFAVLFLDFDRFKTINDSLGHDTGDLLLKEIAARLRSAVRSGDSLSRVGREHTTARLGGDEFVVLLDGITASGDATIAADRMLEAFSNPYHLGQHKVYSTASIGIVTSDIAAQNAEDVLRDADTAMYEAKLAGKGRYAVFDVSMRQRVQNRLNLETDLRKALDAGQLFLMYQPIVSLETGQVESFEALIRWKHPERGLISPAEFIPIAEDTGLIVPIGEWVLREACRQFARWKRDAGDAAPRSISVNVSRVQLLLPGLPETIRQILSEMGLPPSSLHLEITESTVMQDSEESIRILRAIKDIGVKLDLDDFGTGYSSLSCLHEFPLDVLKIDRSFVANIERGREFAALIHAVASLARNLGISVIAEGIETIEQLAVLQTLECEFGQGYYFARPMTGEAAATFRLCPDLPRGGAVGHDTAWAAAGVPAAESICLSGPGLE